MLVADKGEEVMFGGGEGKSSGCDDGAGIIQRMWLAG